MSRLKHFISELQRRKVFRVAGVYLIAAWAAIEVADTVFPNLGLPQWTVTLVIALAALALPLVLILAWMFDLTREGMRRTGPAGAASSSTPDDSAPTTAASGWGRKGFAAASVVIVAGVALWWMSAHGEEQLDNDRVAVMPFRVAGADASVAYLREGLMDLLAATLTGRDGVPAAISPRTLTQVLRERMGSLDADPGEEQALEIARAIGAGRILEGEVVGSADDLSVSARLYDASTGDELTRTSFRSPADSLHGIVNRIVTRLIAVEAGLGEDRLASVTTTSLPALRAYLEGAQAFRRGHHFAAVHAWDRALDLDSTFALAGLGLSRAGGWTVIPSRHSGRAFAIAWRGRDQLGQADRALLQASSPRYPLLASYQELIAARQEAVERFPHDPDLRYLVGDGYLHYGAAAGIEDPFEKGRSQLIRVVAADSTHMEALTHLYDLAVEAHDTASMARYGDLLLAVDSSSPYAIKVLYQRAPAAIDLDTLPAPALIHTTIKGFFGGPDSAAVDAAWRARAGAQNPTDRQLLDGLSAYLAVWEGRSRRMWEVMDRAEIFAESPAQRLRLALFSVADTQRAAYEAAEVRRRIVELKSADDSMSRATDLVNGQCMLAHWEAAQGATAAADHISADLAHWASAREGIPDNASEQLARNTAQLCADLVQATLAVGTRSADAIERLASVDARLDAGLRVTPLYYETANLHVARLWRVLGRPDQALRSVQRRVLLPAYGLLHLESFGEEARILDDLGRSDEAVPAYARFLAWRERAEGGFAEQAARDRARLAALLEQRG